VVVPAHGRLTAVIVTEYVGMLVGPWVAGEFSYVYYGHSDAWEKSVTLLCIGEWGPRAARVRRYWSSCYAGFLLLRLGMLPLVARLYFVFFYGHV
jgi:hypothetical protein